MDKTIIGVVGAVAGLASLDGAAQAATVTAPGELKAAQSFADLLDPIPNAVALLQAADLAAARTARNDPATDETVQVAQVYISHHHHHHHRSWRHHHHHHHHRGVVIRGPGVRIGIGRHRHHHHHNHY
jgi:hypothetical protein